LFTKNPEILEEEKSPQDILQILGFNTSEIETQPQKGKWAYVAEELATKDTLPPEADEILEEGKKWRQNCLPLLAQCHQVKLWNPNL
jgi:hypothetical protein